MWPIKKMVFILIFFSLIIGCGPTNRSPAEPQKNDSSNNRRRTSIDRRSRTPRETKDWNLVYHSQCPGKNKEDCRGSYGFELLSDGSFKVGPGPNGEMYTGVVIEEDLKEIKGLKQRILAITPSTPGTTRSPTDYDHCHPNINPDIYETIEMTNDTQSLTLLQSSDSDFCFNRITNEEALQLSSEMRILLEKYHPEKFPNDCLVSRHALHELFLKVSQCDRDEECSYLNENFLPIPIDQVNSIPQENCAFVRPLIVANYFGAVSHQLKLLMLRDEVKEVCDKEIRSFSCNSEHFRPRPLPPICHHGRCTVKSTY
jgi:hypothetical protein